jgi:putative hydrolase of the HAD superfamily
LGKVFESEAVIMDSEIRAVYFDLGGVYYTEGFREGLFAIARKHGVDEHSFFEAATQVIFANGYVRGEAPERIFWDELAAATGVETDLFTDRALILAAFKPLPGMVSLVSQTREFLPVGLLTDQCNWLYELDDRDGLLSAFDAVINSYEEGFTKRDSEIFRIACQRLDTLPEEVIFFDDNTENVTGAREFGMRAFLFEDADQAEEILIREGILK